MEKLRVKFVDFWEDINQSESNFFYKVLSKTFVVEFKRNSTPEIALTQIEEKRYWEPFKILETKKIVLAGITFNKTNEGVAVLCKTKDLE